MQTIFIDWYKTLSDSLFWEHLKQTDLKKYDAITKSFLNVNGDKIVPWMRGEYDSEDMCRLISKDTNIPFGYIFENLKLSAENMVITDKRVFHQIEELRLSGKKVVIATDNMDTFTRWTIPSLNLYSLFDGVLNSWELHALKGDFIQKKSIFFDDYMSKSNLDPTECILVDDSEDKNGSLGEYGLKYFKIDNSRDLFTILQNL